MELSGNRQQLARLDLRGYKTIRELDGLELGAITVLIGANGAGKSNFISFFRLLSWMTTPPGELQFYVGKAGGASTLLHGGPSVTPQMEATLTFRTIQGTNQYHMRLFHGARDTLVFAEERFRFAPSHLKGEANWSDLRAGHTEARLIERAAHEGKPGVTARTILGLLRRCVVYQFHNTSETARIRQRWNVDDNRLLKEDGANMAAVLYRLRETKPRHYQRIVETLRMVAPFFADFVLEPSDGTILLQWRERHFDMVFGPHQASDGTIRTMALLTLLLQPEEDLPTVIILDEPELGLHPYAIEVLAGLLRGISSKVQVILATQSTTLVDQFEAAEVVVVDRANGASSFTRLSAEPLREWLTAYSLAELWEKNVIGGRPGAWSA